MKSKCTIPGCDRPLKCKGMCHTHYERFRRNGTLEYQRNGNYKHGKSSTPEWKAWVAMRRRCYDNKQPGWADYGGRGISVCSRWLGEDGFENFLADMGEKPTPKHQLDRIDVNKDYSPDNCRWVTKAEQNRNQRKTVWCLVDGKKMCLSEAARAIGISPNALFQRFYRGNTLPERVKIVGV